MKAWVLEKTANIAVRQNPLNLRERTLPEPGPAEVLIRVSACGVCHTELDEIEGRLPVRLPVIPGHQVIGRIEQSGPAATRFTVGERVGVAWIFSACGGCPSCLSGRENLCSSFRGTGVHADGGYAEFMTVPERFAYPIPESLADTDAAPLLCAGAIGYRALSLAGPADGDSVGLSGFGGSAHLVLKMIRHRLPNSRIYVFARNPESRAFALELGAAWTGDFSRPAPVPLQAVIDTTPAWIPVIVSLESLAPGGRLVINAIRKEDYDRQVMADIDYSRHLWLEKEIKSVANVCRSDVSEFLDLAAEAGIRPEVEVYSFMDANRALYDLKNGGTRGARVLKVSG